MCGSVLTGVHVLHAFPPPYPSLLLLSATLGVVLIRSQTGSGEIAEGFRGQNIGRSGDDDDAADIDIHLDREKLSNDMYDLC